MYFHYFVFSVSPSTIENTAGPIGTIQSVKVMHYDATVWQDYVLAGVGYYSRAYLCI